MIWNSPKIEQYDEGEAEHTRRLEIDCAEEVRANSILQNARCVQGLRRFHDKSTKEVKFQIGNTVLRRIQKTDGRHKLLSPWEGPFKIAKVLRPGTYELMTMEDITIRNTWHVSQLRIFYT